MPSKSYLLHLLILSNSISLVARRTLEFLNCFNNCNLRRHQHSTDSSFRQGRKPLLQQHWPGIGKGDSPPLLKGFKSPFCVFPRPRYSSKSQFLTFSLDYLMIGASTTTSQVFSLSNSLFHTSSVAQKIGFLKVLQQGRMLLGGKVRNMGLTAEECDGGNARNKVELVHPATQDYVQEAVEAIRAGKVIAVPTDTLYGFACDACSLEGIKQIYEIKGRKYSNPLAICVGDVEDIKRFAATEHLPTGLLGSLLPGPVTVVLRRGETSILEKSLNPGLDSIGVRVPDCNFIRLITLGSRSALALTSANLSGQPSSVDIKDFENLWEHCAWIYDGGVLPSGRAGSTVVDLTKPGKYKIIRTGSAKEETVAILEKHSVIEDESGR